MGNGDEIHRSRPGGRSKKLKREPERLVLLRLALKLGVWDVDALADAMPMDTFQQWLAFYMVEPFGDEWRQAARLASVLVAASGAKIEGELEEKFLPGGGMYRGLNQDEARMLDELRKVPELRAQLDRR